MPNSKRTDLGAESPTQHGRFEPCNSQAQETNHQLGLRRKFLSSIQDSPFRLGSSTVKLIAGEEEEVFIADKAILCRESSFFDNAFNSRFLEQSNEIRMPEESPTTVHLLLSWMYGHKISWFRGKLVSAMDLSAGDVLKYIRLFNAADKMCIMRLKAESGDTIFDWDLQHDLCQQHVLPAALSLAVTDELQELLALKVAGFCSANGGNKTPAWLTECLEANPSFTPKVLEVQATLAKRFVNMVINCHHSPPLPTRTIWVDVINEMTDEIFEKSIALDLITASS